MILSIYGASARRDTHVAPLGLWSWLGRACYRHAAPLGLRVGQDARPTGMCTIPLSTWVFRLDMLPYTHCAPLERRDWKDRRAIDISLLWSERYMSPRWLWVGQDARPTGMYVANEV